jgi:hypothetical protein
MTGRSPLGVLAGIGAGAAAMYFLDPDRGARRRALVADKARSAVNQLPRAVRVTKRDLANRAHGFWAEAHNLISKEEAPDDIVVERVRSKLGRIVSHPHAIKATCSGGNITLSGPIFTDEASRLLKCVGSVQGVRSVENNLDLHDSAEGISALQGGRLREPRPEFLQSNWSPAARFVAGTAGAAAMGFGLFKRNALGIAVGTAGAALLARSATNLDVRHLIGEAVENAEAAQEAAADLLELEQPARKEAAASPGTVH